MGTPTEHRFKLMIDDLACEVFVTRTNETIEIVTVNVIGDCTLTADDLDDDQKRLILAKADVLLKNEE